ncbi:MAG: hypothetical protein Q9188_006173 [Gyalolechia gomerana]
MQRTALPPDILQITIPALVRSPPLATSLTALTKPISSTPKTRNNMPPPPRRSKMANRATETWRQNTLVAVKYLGPIVFLWSGEVEKRRLRLPRHNRLGWFEGSGKQFIAFDKVTGLVKGQFPRAEAESSHYSKEREEKAFTGQKRVEINALGENNKRAVIGTSNTAPEVAGRDRPRPQEKLSSPASYNPNAPPFDFFTRHKIGPLDSDPDIVWQLEQGSYRAYRLSTLKHDPMARPALVTTKSAKDVVIQARNWLTGLKRRATGNPNAKWDDQRPQARAQRNSVPFVRAGQAVDTASHEDRAKQPIGHRPDSVQRLDQQRGQQRRTVPGADHAMGMTANTTLNQYNFPLESTQKRKRKSSDEQTATTAPKRAKTALERQRKPKQRLPPRVIISAPPPETAIDLNQYYRLIQHAKPQSSNTVIQQPAPCPSQNYFAAQSSLVARSFDQPKVDNQQQGFFTALLGADAFSTPADWGSM